MNKFNKSIAITFALIIIFCLSAASFASKADELLADADKAVVAAKASKATVDKKENYKKAAELYTSVSTDYANTPQTAKALYKLAILENTTENTDAFNVYNARNTLKKLLNEYDKSSPELGKILTKTEVDQVLTIVADAKKLKHEIDIKLDKENSHKTLYKIIDALVRLTGKKHGFSYWFAIILLTVIIKLATTPLTKAQFKSMKEMQTITPLIKEIQAKYKGDQKVIGEKTMALYKEHKINPFASCLPLLVQMPIIMMLFYTIQQYEFQLRNGTFAWITESNLWHQITLHIPFTGGIVYLPAKNLAEPDLILVVLYLISMYFSTKMSTMDPSQADQQKMMAIMMPLMFGFIFATYPSAFLLYWLVLNILQTGQQYLIMHRPAAAVVNAPVEAPKPDEGGAGGRRRRRR
ncbi:MAG: membrane protein insertase YidC [Armatimonadetes bacterium]|nr:membrane protein insertase YidC [Armatimonadota bacterium]